jgi:hypothetical protein
VVKENGMNGLAETDRFIHIPNYSTNQSYKATLQHNADAMGGLV